MNVDGPVILPAYHSLQLVTLSIPQSVSYLLPRTVALLPFLHNWPISCMAEPYLAVNNSPFLSLKGKNYSKRDRHSNLKRQRQLQSFKREAKASDCSLLLIWVAMMTCYLKMFQLEYDFHIKTLQNEEVTNFKDVSALCCPDIHQH